MTRDWCEIVIPVPEGNNIQTFINRPEVQKQAHRALEMVVRREWGFVPDEVIMHAVQFRSLVKDDPEFIRRFTEAGANLETSTLAGACLLRYQIDVPDKKEEE